jgi:hypothetical protein
MSNLEKMRKKLTKNKSGAGKGDKPRIDYKKYWESDYWKHLEDSKKKLDKLYKNIRKK